MVVVRDPATGEMRAPTASELRALRKAEPPGPTRLSPTAAPVTRPNGTRVYQLGERDQVDTVVTRDADGKLVQQCVHGAEAADASMATDAKSANSVKSATMPAAPAGEHAHDYK
jgi:hypothetical protein